MTLPLFKAPPESLCVLRLSAIGDVCNTIAAVQAVQKEWPETRLTWITGKAEAQLLQAIPGIEVIVFDKKAGWRGYTELWRQLKGRHFDALLHMQYAIRASIATLGIKARYKLGFDKKRSQDFQTLFTSIQVPSPEKPHVLDGLMAFSHTLGIPAGKPEWSLSYPEEDSAWAASQLSQTKPNLVIVPAASKGYKNWHAQGYAELIEHAASQGWHIVLAGSPAETEVKLAADVESKLSQGVHNLVGQSSLMQMLALLDKADLVIAPDTGPAHMANAMNTPVIGLYAHHNPQRTGPYNYSDYVVSAYEEAILAETGKTPEQLSWRTRVQDKNAMSRISPDQVISMFDKAVADFSLNSK